MNDLRWTINAIDAYWSAFLLSCCTSLYSLANFSRSSYSSCSAWLILLMARFAFSRRFFHLWNKLKHVSKLHLYLICSRHLRNFWLFKVGTGANQRQRLIYACVVSRFRVHLRLDCVRGDQMELILILHRVIFLRFWYVIGLRWCDWTVSIARTLALLLLENDLFFWDTSCRVPIVPRWLRIIWFGFIHAFLDACVPDIYTGDEGAGPLGACH